MLKRLLLILLIVIPALEIWLLIEVGQAIGGWSTFALLVLTGLFGYYLTRIEVRKLVMEAREDFAAGRLPGRQIIDGICLFVGGLLLLVPGFITDAVGLFLVLPPTRLLLRGWLLHLIKKLFESSWIRFYRW